MGEQPKLLLPLADGEPVLRHAVRVALSHRPVEVVVVVRPDLPALAEALSDLQVRAVSNPRFEEGMATSLAAGIGALGEGVEGALLMQGDTPFVSAAIVERLLAAYLRERKPITVPLYGSEVGPPTLFAREVFPNLMRLVGDTGGRQLLSRHPEWVCRVPFSSEERPVDVDTPEDLQRFGAPGFEVDK
jgi:molybdenum cofactor cytidylyltransferase